MSNAKPTRKVTVVLPKDLLVRAIKASGKGVTTTIRMGLELVAAKDAYEGIRKLRGKYKPSISVEELREDR